MSAAAKVVPIADAQRFCRDCRHAMLAVGNDWYWARCALAESLSMVTGEVEHGICRNERNDLTACGPEGRWFQPRDGR